jgi:putative heme-binding domain-containing protein
LADDVVGILTRLAAAREAQPPRTTEADVIAERLARLATNPAVAASLAAACAGGDDAGGPTTSRREATLDVIDRARPKDVPDAWVESLASLLPGAAKTGAPGEAASLGPVLRTLAGLSLSQAQRARLAPQVLAIAGDATSPPAIVTLALRVVGPSETIPAPLIDRLVAILGDGRQGGNAAGRPSGDASPLDRSAAAAALATATCSTAVLESIAATFETLPPGDVAVLLPGITAARGKPLTRAIAALAAASRPEGVPRDLIEKAVTALPEADAAAGHALLRRIDLARAGEREAYDRLAASLPEGDPARGHAVFLSNKAACTTCHAMAYAGGRIGPDLSKIGAIRTPRDLLEAIVLPSASFVRSYEPVVIATADGRAYAGVIREENDAEVVLQTTATATERIPRDAIESLETGTVSLMPKGYDTLLTPQELADLVAFLARAR